MWRYKYASHDTKLQKQSVKNVMIFWFGNFPEWPHTRADKMKTLKNDNFFIKSFREYALHIYFSGVVGFRTFV